MADDIKPEPLLTNSDDRADLREQLFNDREIGPACRVQVSTDRVAMLHGLLLDVDRDKIKESGLVPGVREGPLEFYEKAVKAWLERHPVLAAAEVRNSGGSLHVIPWIAGPVVFDTDGERERWAGIVEAVQGVLPVDPHQPGLTALTRPLGSVNGKNNATVTRLKEGTPVPADQVERLFEQMRKAPFRTVMQVLLGAERIQPCPACGGEGTTLTAGDLVGFCYGSCGKVKLARLYDLFFAPTPNRRKEATLR